MFKKVLFVFCSVAAVDATFGTLRSSAHEEAAIRKRLRYTPDWGIENGYTIHIANRDETGEGFAAWSGDLEEYISSEFRAKLLSSDTDVASDASDSWESFWRESLGSFMFDDSWPQSCRDAAAKLAALAAERLEAECDAEFLRRFYFLGALRSMSRHALAPSRDI
jgi:hypothetical protein